MCGTEIRQPLVAGIGDLVIRPLEGRPRGRPAERFVRIIYLGRQSDTGCCGRITPRATCLIEVRLEAAPFIASARRLASIEGLGGSPPLDGWILFAPGTSDRM